MTHHEHEFFTLEQLMQDTSKFGILHLLGMQIVTAEAGIGRVSIQIDERLMHPQQIVHGGVIFTLADTAMSMALISVLPVGTPFGTIEAKINFMLPVHKGELLAEGKIVHKGRSTAVLEATVFNIIEGKQHAIARVLGTFSIARSKNLEPKSH
ncbi:MAG: PaaI family thioesterase [Ktedonobacteraceae bacterium]